MTPNRQPGKESSCTPILWKEGHDLAAKATQRIAAAAAAKGEKKEIRTFVYWVCANADPVEDNIAEVIKVDMQPNKLLIQYFVEDLKDFSFTFS